MALKFKRAYGDDMTHRRWAYFGSLWHDQEPNDLPAAVVDQLSVDQIERLAHIPFNEEVYVMAGDGGVKLSEAPPRIVAKGLKPAAELDTAEEVAVRASNIETGVDSENREYVDVDGRRTRQDPVDGDRIVQLKWNVPRGGGSGGPDSAFMF